MQISDVRSPAQRSPVTSSMITVRYTYLRSACLSGRRVQFGVTIDRTDCVSSTVARTDGWRGRDRRAGWRVREPTGGQIRTRRTGTDRTDRWNASTSEDARTQSACRVGPSSSVQDGSGAMCLQVPRDRSIDDPSRARSVATDGRDVLIGRSVNRRTDGRTHSLTDPCACARSVSRSASVLQAVYESGCSDRFRRNWRR